MSSSGRSKSVDSIGPICLPLELGDGESDEFELALHTIGSERLITVTKGDVLKDEAPIVRVSSACNYAHIFGSQLCDCRWQLEEAKRRISKEGVGLIVFAFDQHGKGVGLENHYRIYTEGQRRNLELVVDAYEKLGYREDARDYGNVILLLRALGLRKFRLLTNSPQRVALFSDAGFDVQRTPLEAPLTDHNLRELVVKVCKLKHIMVNVSKWLQDRRLTATTS